MGGKKRTLHFSMNFWAAFTDELGISMSEIDTILSQTLSLKTIIALVYAGVLANDQEEGNEIDYTIYTVGKWLDDVNTDQFKEIIQTLTESKILGNDLNAGVRKKESKSTIEPKK